MTKTFPKLKDILPTIRQLQTMSEGEIMDLRSGKGIKVRWGGGKFSLDHEKDFIEVGSNALRSAVDQMEGKHQRLGDLVIYPHGFDRGEKIVALYWKGRERFVRKDELLWFLRVA